MMGHDELHFQPMPTQKGFFFFLHVYTKGAPWTMHRKMSSPGRAPRGGGTQSWRGCAKRPGGQAAKKESSPLARGDVTIAVAIDQLPEDFRLDATEQAHVAPAKCPQARLDPAADVAIPFEQLQQLGLGLTRP